MFGFLKDKIKDWVDKTKEKLKPAEAVDETETKEEQVEEKKEVKETKKQTEIKEKETKKPKEKKTKEKIEIKEDKETEEIEKTKQKLDLVKDIKNERQESKQPETKIIETQVVEQKSEILEEKEISKEPEKKQGFFSKLLGKKKKEEIITKEEITKEPEITKPEEIIEEKPIEKIKFKDELKSKEIKEIKPDLITEKEELLEKTQIIQNIPEKEEKKPSFLSRIKSSLVYRITQEEFDSIFEDLEMLLLENNVALEVVEDIKKNLATNLIGKEIKKDDLEQEIKNELKRSLNDILIDPDDVLDIVKLKKEKPFIILFFGINGTGKTTSIAKLAYALTNKGYTVALAAADTFRAASIEQISEHAKNLNVHLIKSDYGSDPASVGFDAIKYAKAHYIDVVLIDTAGRMHTKSNLLSEMEKICRVTNPDLKIFVAESIAGNDATEQAKAFNELIRIDGSILSKADIDEKGGTIISISHATKKPIFYLGTGQKYTDLKLFNKEDYIKSLGLE